MPTLSQVQRFFFQFILIGGAISAFQGVRFIGDIYVARNFNNTEFVFWVFLFIYASLAGMMNLGINNHANIKIAFYSRLKKTKAIIRLNTSIDLIFWCSSFLLSIFLLLFGESFKTTFAVLISITSINYFLNCQLKLRAQRKNEVAFFHSCLGSVTFLVILVFLNRLKIDFFTIMTIAPLALFTISIFVNKYHCPISLSAVSARQMKLSIARGLPLLLMSLSLSMFILIDKLILKRVMNEDDLSEYLMAFRLFEIILFPVIILITQWTPHLNKFNRTDSAVGQIYLSLIVVIGLYFMGCSFLLFSQEFFVQVSKVYFGFNRVAPYPLQILIMLLMWSGVLILNVELSRQSAIKYSHLLRFIAIIPMASISYYLLVKFEHSMGFILGFNALLYAIGLVIMLSILKSSPIRSLRGRQKSTQE
ncbi:MAG: hypothetical protein VW307_03340 [Alphaproteobacteria bacterium]